jgi:hypothetical protein
MKHIITNWKTTLTGISTLIGGVLLVANKNTTEGITAIMAGIGQIFAKDANI